MDSNGEVLCPSCGLVEGYSVSKNPNWKSFGTPDEDTTSGAPLDKYGRGSSTEISYQGEFSDAKEYGKWKRLRRTDSEKRSGENTIERNIYKANIQMIRMKSTLNIPPPIVNTAMDIYSKAAHGGYLRGRTIYGTLCATVYASYRAHGVNISLRDFSRKVELDKTIVGGYYRGLKSGGYTPKDEDNRVYKLISKIVIAKGFSGEVELNCKKVYKILVDGKYTVGKSPSSIGCSILYMVNIIMDLGLIQKDIAFLSGVTEVSLRNNTNKFKEAVLFTTYH